MKERIKFTEIIVILAILAVLVIAVWSVVHYCFTVPATKERSPIVTKKELRIMDEAKARHGDYTQIITGRAIYLDRIGENGKPERVWVVRRRIQ